MALNICSPGGIFRPNVSSNPPSSQSLMFEAQGQTWDQDVEVTMPIGGIVTTIKEPDANYYYIAGANGPRVYLNVLGYDWELLYEQINYFKEPPVTSSRLSVFRGTELMDDAHASEISMDISYPSLWDSNYKEGDTTITAAYLTNNTTLDHSKTSIELMLCEFDFTTGLYGTPFGSIYIRSSSPYFAFAKRPDGSYILVYGQWVWNGSTNEQRLYHAIYRNGTWTAYDSGLTCPQNPVYLNSAVVKVQGVQVDSVGRTHFWAGTTSPGNFYYGQIAADDSLTFLEDGTFTDGEFTYTKQARIWGDSFYSVNIVATSPDWISTTKFVIGTPLNAPVWTIEDGPDIFGNATTAKTLAMENGKFVFYWWSYGDTNIYKSIRNAENDWSTPEVVYDFTTDPPTGFTELTAVINLSVKSLNLLSGGSSSPINTCTIN